MTTDLTQLHLEAMVTLDMTKDEVMAVDAKVNFIANQIKEIKASLKEAKIEWIKENGEFTFGDKVHCVGRDKDIQVNDKAECFMALWEACGGDVKQVAECLTSKPFKPAASKSQLGAEEYQKQFRETWKDKIVLKEIPTTLLK